jgi:catechol 2,3-dioxygenase-like lactoylglutathione lyase family enzyme
MTTDELLIMLKAGNVTVLVSDLDRAINFYTQILGLKLDNRYENEWAEIIAPGLTIGLHPVMEHGPQPGKSESLSIGFTVDSLNEEMSILKSRGIIFSPNIVEDGPVRIAFFTDPDKTPLYICEVQDENR